MGTRADFYIGRGKEAEWLGSIAWDGYPENEEFNELFKCESEKRFRQVTQELLEREDGTTPEMGWPWPWEDSCTTDYAYAFSEGKVFGSSFGHSWFDPLNPPENEDEIANKVDFPDMSSQQKVTFGKRSGVMLLSVPKETNGN